MNPNLEKATSPKAMLMSIVENRKLIGVLTQRDIVGRYRGSVIGLGWSFFNPLLMLAVYTFVFSVVFKARWGGVSEEAKGAFAVVLFVGTLIHGLFSECVNKAPTMILGAINYVKKVVFPLEILPVVTLCSAMFHAAISLVVLLAANFIVFGHIPWTAILFPLVLAPIILTTLGVTWILAGLGVYIRDIAQFTLIMTMVMMFLSPVFYPVSALPAQLRPWLYLNPLTFVIEQGRAVLIFGQLPQWGGLAKHLAVGLVVASIGFWLFQKLRRGFADVV